MDRRWPCGPDHHSDHRRCRLRRNERPHERGVSAAAPKLSAEDVFVADILDTPDLNRTVPRDSLIELGKLVCQAIPEAPSHDNLMATLGTTKFGPQVMEIG